MGRWKTSAPSALQFARPLRPSQPAAPSVRDLLHLIAASLGRGSDISAHDSAGCIGAAGQTVANQCLALGSSRVRSGGSLPAGCRLPGAILIVNVRSQANVGSISSGQANAGLWLGGVWGEARLELGYGSTRLRSWVLSVIAIPLRSCTRVYGAPPMLPLLVPPVVAPP